MLRLHRCGIATDGYGLFTSICPSWCRERSGVAPSLLTAHSRRSCHIMRCTAASRNRTFVAVGTSPCRRASAGSVARVFLASLDIRRDFSRSILPGGADAAGPARSHPGIASEPFELRRGRKATMAAINLTLAYGCSDESQFCKLCAPRSYLAPMVRQTSF